MKFSNLGTIDTKKIRKRVKKTKKDRKQRQDLAKGPLYLSDDGEDVIFNMNFDDGLWKGKRTSEMASDHDGRKILRWLLRKDFDEEYTDIIEEQLKEVHF